MMDIKYIVFKNNHETLQITLGKENKIQYNNLSNVIDDEQAMKYLTDLFLIIKHWDNEYINTCLIDNNIWSLSIVFTNDIKREYYGKASYPDNFEAFERLINRIIKEVYNG